MLLPEIREGITIESCDGSSTNASAYLLVDNIKNQYYRVDDITMVILTHWSSRSIDIIIKDVLKKEGLHLSVEHIESVLTFLQEHELLKSDSSEAENYIFDKRRKKKICHLSCY